MVKQLQTFASASGKVEKRGKVDLPNGIWVHTPLPALQAEESWTEVCNLAQVIQAGCFVDADDHRMGIAGCSRKAENVNRPAYVNAIWISLLADGLVIIVFALKLEDVGADAGDDWDPYCLWLFSGRRKLAALRVAANTAPVAVSQ